MNIVRVTALLVGIPLFAVAAQAKSANPPIDKSAAPADEYFGKQKMSALGIRLRIGDLGRRLHAHMLADADALHDAVILEDSYHAWDARYPRDGWLAPTAFHLEQLFTEVQLPEGRSHATAMLHYIDGRFGNTKYGHLSRLRLAQGFPGLKTPVAVSTTPSPAGATTGDMTSGTQASPAAAMPGAAVASGSPSAAAPSAAPAMPASTRSTAP